MTDGKEIVVTGKELRLVAEEFNILMELDPKIKTGDKITKAELISDILKTSAMLTPEDTLSKEAIDILKNMGVDIPKTKAQIAKDEKEKKETEKKAEKKEKKTKPKVDRDEFGFVLGTQRSLFVQALKAKPCTMKEIKSADWNKQNQSMYNTWKIILDKGKGVRDENGVMRLI